MANKQGWQLPKRLVNFTGRQKKLSLIPGRVYLSHFLKHFYLSVDQQYLNPVFLDYLDELNP